MWTHNKKMAREHRLVRDFNLILYEDFQSILLTGSCTQTDTCTFVNNRNKFSNLSALVAQMFVLGSHLVHDTRSCLKLR